MTANHSPRITAAHWLRMSWHAREQYRRQRLNALRAALPDLDLDEQPEPVAPRGHADWESRRPVIEQMLGDGAHAAEVARQLGATVAALERQCRRHDRKDLAAAFSAEHVFSRKRRCSDCGRPCSHGAKRCLPCARRALAAGGVA